MGWGKWVVCANNWQNLINNYILRYFWQGEETMVGIGKNPILDIFGNKLYIFDIITLFIALFVFGER